MSKHRKHPILLFSSNFNASKGFTLKPIKAHAGPHPAVDGPGWWQIVEELSPGIFTPATDVFPPDALWNDGSTSLPGSEDWSVQPILDQLDALQTEYGRCFGANFQWPA